MGANMADASDANDFGNGINANSEFECPLEFAMTAVPGDYYRKPYHLVEGAWPAGPTPSGPVPALRIALAANLNQAAPDLVGKPFTCGRVAIYWSAIIGAAQNGFLPAATFFHPVPAGLPDTHTAEDILFLPEGKQLYGMPPVPFELSLRCKAKGQVPPLCAHIKGTVIGIQKYD